MRSKEWFVGHQVAAGRTDLAMIYGGSISPDKVLRSMCGSRTAWQIASSIGSSSFCLCDRMTERLLPLGDRIGCICPTPDSSCRGIKDLRRDSPFGLRCSKVAFVLHETSQLEVAV